MTDEEARALGFEPIGWECRELGDYGIWSDRDHDQIIADQDGDDEGWQRLYIARAAQ